MTNQTCADCGRPAGDAFVCRPCTVRVRRKLQLFADLAKHADDKRARFGTAWRAGTIGRTPEQPLPYDPRVTEVLDQAHRVLREARDLAQRAEPSTVLSSDHPAALAVWLTSRLDAIRRHPDGPRTFGQLRAAAERMVKLFDRPPDRVYVGRCGHEDCPESLYADQDNTATVVKCPRCHTEHPIAERREVLAVGVEDYLGTVKEISRLLRETFGDDVSERMIRGAADHGLIVARGKRLELDKLNRQRESVTFRIGDVREAVAVIRTDKTQRAAVRRQARQEQSA